MNSMIRSYRKLATLLLVVLALCLQSSLLRGQKKQVGAGKADSNAEAIQTFPEPEPQADRVAIDGHKKVLRGEVALDSITTVRLYEKPTSETVYDSSVSVERGGIPIATYRVGRMIKHQALRLVHTVLIRSGDGGMLVCEYEGGAVGAKEGFAVLRFSPSGFELHTLPLTEFGKIVVFRSTPERAEIWSALPNDANSAADPKPYVTQSCRWQLKGYLCGPPKRKPGRFAPGDIDDPGIEIQP